MSDTLMLEFDGIMKGILKKDVTPEDVQHLARKWAEHTLKVYDKYSVKYARDEEVERLYGKYIGKILSMRERAGLENPEMEGYG